MAVESISSARETSRVNDDTRVQEQRQADQTARAEQDRRDQETEATRKAAKPPGTGAVVDRYV